MRDRELLQLVVLILLVLAGSVFFAGTSESAAEQRVEVLYSSVENTESAADALIFDFEDAGQVEAWQAEGAPLPVHMPENFLRWEGSPGAPAFISLNFPRQLIEQGGIVLQARGHTAEAVSTFYLELLTAEGRFRLPFSVRRENWREISLPFDRFRTASEQTFDPRRVQELRIVAPAGNFQLDVANLRGL